MSPGLGPPRMGPPRTPLEIGESPHYLSSFALADTRFERLEGQEFSHYQDNSFRSTNPVVLDSSSGNIIASSTQPNQEPDPISRFYSSEAPWDPQGMRGMNHYDQPPRFTTNHNPVTRPHAPYIGHRDTARSNPESQLTGKPEDSAYFTGPHTLKSAVSVGEDYREPIEDNHSIMNGIGGMNLQPNHQHQGSFQTSMQRSTLASFGEWSDQDQDHDLDHVSSLECAYSDCKDITRFKNQSELK